MPAAELIVGAENRPTTNIDARHPTGGNEPARVLAVTTGSGTAGVLRTAAALTRRFGCRVVALHARPFRDVFIAGGRGGFGASREVGGALPTTLLSGAPGITEWYADGADVVSATAAWGASFDLIVAAHPRSRFDDAAATVDEALCGVGKPVLVVPEAGVDEMGQSVVIAWDRSLAAVRALSSAQPFLRRTERARVVGLQSSASRTGPSANNVARRLRGRGIPADVRWAGRHRCAFGRAVLREAADVGADFLVVGAYARGRWREWLFGGPTQGILANAAAPVLLVR